MNEIIDLTNEPDQMVGELSPRAIRQQLIALQRQTKHDILVELRIQSYNSYNASKEAIIQATKSISLINLNETNITYNNGQDPQSMLCNKLQCIQYLTHKIKEQSKIKFAAINNYHKYSEKIKKSALLLPDGLLATKNAKIAAKVAADDLKHNNEVNRMFVACEADKRISSARLLKLPEDVLFVIKSFFTYETRFELLEHKYPVVPRLNLLSPKNSHRFCALLHITPEYFAGITVELADMITKFNAYGLTYGIPVSHAGRKQFIADLIQKYKETFPHTALKIIKTLSILVKTKKEKKAIMLMA